VHTTALSASTTTDGPPGMLSCQQAQNVIDGKKRIILNPSAEQRTGLDTATFAEDEVYGMDVLVTSADDGKARHESARTTVYQRDSTVTYQLKMQTSRKVFSDVQKKSGAFPFNIRALEDEKRARLGLQEAVQHSLVKEYDVMCANLFLSMSGVEVLSSFRQLHTAGQLRRRLPLHDRAPPRRPSPAHAPAIVVQARAREDGEGARGCGPQGAARQAAPRAEEEEGEGRSRGHGGGEVSAQDSGVCWCCVFAADDMSPCKNEDQARAAASGPNSRNVRVTRSTFSRKAFAVNLASLTVDVLKVLIARRYEQDRDPGQPDVTHAIRMLSSVLRVRLTACGCNSASTSIALFAISACSADAKGTLIFLHSIRQTLNILATLTLCANLLRT
jgi:hypothetical protein